MTDVGYPDLQLVLSFKGVLELRDSEELVRVRLGARSLDPLAVRLGVDVADGPVHWVFARELLVRGLRTAAGEGHVRVAPCAHRSRRSMVEVVLEGDDGFARLLLPRGPLAHFLEASDAFTRGDVCEEILESDLEDALEDILASDREDPFAE